jgi:hypothetical protein
MEFTFPLGNLVSDWLQSMTSTGVELTTITFVDFAYLLPLGKIIMGRIDPLTY